MTDWSLLGGNPAPGNVGSVEAGMTALSGIYGRIDSTQSGLSTIGTSNNLAAWFGVAADTFREAIGRIPHDLADLGEYTGQAVTALRSFADELAALQQQANAALQRALDAEDARASAQSGAEGAAAAAGAAAADAQRSSAQRDAASAAAAAATARGDSVTATSLARTIEDLSGQIAAAYSRQSSASADATRLQAVARSAAEDLQSEQRVAASLREQWQTAVANLTRALQSLAEHETPHRSFFSRIESDVAGLDNKVARFELRIAHDVGHGVHDVVNAGREVVRAAEENHFLQEAYKWGRILGPFVTPFIELIPVVGPVLEAAILLDQAFRLGQDLVDHHYRAAFEQSVGMATTALGAANDPLLGAVGKMKYLDAGSEGDNFAQSVLRTVVQKDQTLVHVAAGKSSFLHATQWAVTTLDAAGSAIAPPGGPSDPQLIAQTSQSALHDSFIAEADGLWHDLSGQSGSDIAPAALQFGKTLLKGGYR